MTTSAIFTAAHASARLINATPAGERASFFARHTSYAAIFADCLKSNYVGQRWARKEAARKAAEAARNVAAAAHESFELIQVLPGFSTQVLDLFATEVAALDALRALTDRSPAFRVQHLRGSQVVRTL